MSGRGPVQQFPHLQRPQRPRRGRQLADRQVTIELTDAARAWLARKGYDPLYGARPLARIIQEYIKKPLAEELLFGKLAHGGQALVTLAADGSGLAIECVPAPEPEVAA